MINDKNLFYPYLLQEHMLWNHLLESPRPGNSNKYPQQSYVSWSIEIYS